MTHRRTGHVGSMAEQPVGAPHHLSEKRQRHRDVYLRDRMTCQWCGEPADTVDHIVPRSQGGSSFKHNLLAACFRCNQSRADMDADLYLSMHHFTVPNARRVQHLIARAKRKEKRIHGNAFH